jgi:DNA-binding HxlR family transcriptional regulator
MWPWFLTFDESQQTVVIGILGFIASFLLGQLYFIRRRKRTTVKNSFNNYETEFAESLLSQYSAKLAALTKIIQNVILRLEYIERGSVLRHTSPTEKSDIESKSIKSTDTLPLSSEFDLSEASDYDVTGHISDVRKKSDITNSRHNIRDRKNNRDEDASHRENLYNIKDMTLFILELLNSRPMNSSEIQNQVKRSREHTSRFMKGLFVKGLVSREIDTKPFVYTITDEGRKLLKVSRNHDLV